MGKVRTAILMNAREKVNVEPTSESMASESMAFSTAPCRCKLKLEITKSGRDWFFSRDFSMRVHLRSFAVKLLNTSLHGAAVLRRFARLNRQDAYSPNARAFG